MGNSGENDELSTVPSTQRGLHNIAPDYRPSRQPGNAGDGQGGQRGFAVFLVWFEPQGSCCTHFRSEHICVLFPCAVRTNFRKLRPGSSAQLRKRNRMAGKGNLALCPSWSLDPTSLRAPLAPAAADRSPVPRPHVWAQDRPVRTLPFCSLLAVLDVNQYAGIVPPPRGRPLGPCLVPCAEWGLPLMSSRGRPPDSLRRDPGSVLLWPRGQACSQTAGAGLQLCSCCVNLGQCLNLWATSRSHYEDQMN